MSTNKSQYPITTEPSIKQHNSTVTQITRRNKIETHEVTLRPVNTNEEYTVTVPRELNGWISSPGFFGLHAFLAKHTIHPLAKHRMIAIHGPRSDGGFHLQEAYLGKDKKPLSRPHVSSHNTLHEALEKAYSRMESSPTAERGQRPHLIGTTKLSFTATQRKALEEYGIEYQRTDHRKNKNTDCVYTINRPPAELLKSHGLTLLVGPHTTYVEYTDTNNDNITWTVFDDYVLKNGSHTTMRPRDIKEKEAHQRNVVKHDDEPETQRCFAVY